MPESVPVTNPLTGETIDVLPFLTAMEDTKSRGISLAENIQCVQDFLSTVYLDRGNTLTPEELAQLCHICIEIRDTLKSINL